MKFTAIFLPGILFISAALACMGDKDKYSLSFTTHPHHKDVTVVQVESKKMEWTNERPPKKVEVPRTYKIEDDDGFLSMYLTYVSVVKNNRDNLDYISRDKVQNELIFMKANAEKLEKYVENHGELKKDDELLRNIRKLKNLTLQDKIKKEELIDQMGAISNKWFPTGSYIVYRLDALGPKAMSLKEIDTVLPSTSTPRGGCGSTIEAFNLNVAPVGGNKTSTPGSKM